MFRPVLRTCTRSIASLRPGVARRFASATSNAVFNWEDPLASRNLLTEDELAISDTAEKYCQEHLAPRVLRMYPLSPLQTLVL